MTTTHNHNNSAGTITKPRQAGDSPVTPMNLSSIERLPEKQVAPVLPGIRAGRPLETFFDVPITLVFEVGRIDISIKELMELKEGVMIDLRQVSVDSIDIRVNDHIIAFGEAIGLKQIYGIRIGELEIFSALDDIEESSKMKKAGG